MSFKLLVINPEKCQLIHPPIRIIGKTLVKFPFAISTIMVGSGNNMHIEHYNVTHFLGINNGLGKNMYLTLDSLPLLSFFEF